MRTMCRFYGRGECLRTPCVFAHDRQQLGQKVKDTQGLKSSLCRYWGKFGHCENKDECEFAHGPGELGQKKPAVPPASRKKGGKEEKEEKKEKEKLVAKRRTLTNLLRGREEVVLELEARK